MLLTSELHAEPEGDDDFADVEWLEPAGADGAVQVCIFISRVLGVREWPNPSALGTSLCACFELANDELCYVVSATSDSIDAICRAQLRNEIARLRKATPAFTVGDLALTDLNARAIVGNQHPHGWIEVNIGRGPSTDAV